MDKKEIKINRNGQMYGCTFAFLTAKTDIIIGKEKINGFNIERLNEFESYVTENIFKTDKSEFETAIKSGTRRADYLKNEYRLITEVICENSEYTEVRSGIIYIKGNEIIKRTEITEIWDKEENLIKSKNTYKVFYGGYSHDIRNNGRNRKSGKNGYENKKRSNKKRRNGDKGGK